VRIAIWFTRENTCVCSLQEVAEKTSVLSDTLHMLSEVTEQVVVRTSTAGQDSLRRDVRRVSDDYEAVSTHARELVEQLQAVLQRWTEFESSHSLFTSWLDTTMQSVENASKVAADLDAKLDLVNQVKVSFDLVSYITTIFHHLSSFFLKKIEP